MTKLILPACAAAVAIAGAALAAAAPGTPPSPPPKLYAEQCASCHGDALEGGNGPALRSALIAAEKPGDIYKIIKSGMPMTAPGSLSEAQAKLLADYIVAQNHR